MSTSKLNQKSVAKISTAEANDIIHNLRSKHIINNESHANINVSNQNDSEIKSISKNNENSEILQENTNDEHFNVKDIMFMFKASEEARKNNEKKHEEELNLLKIKLEKYENHLENNNHTKFLNNNKSFTENDLDMTDPFQKLALTSQLLHHLSPPSKIENFEIKINIKTRTYL